jgi:FkbM family methyltransferase
MIIIKLITSYFRILLFFPLYLTNKLLFIYYKIICLFDPGGFECKLEELYQKQIDLKIKRIKNFHNLNYIPKLCFKRKEILFYTPTKVSNYRANTIYSKEVDTIKWIDNFGNKNTVFFDIGANIGVYSLYSSILYGCKVFAFEPQYNNLLLLEKNIQLNKVEKLVTIIPNPIFNKNKLDFLLSKINNLAGSASATFFNKKKFKNENYKKKLTLSLSVDFLVKKLSILRPNMIKIDVDGNEVDIIKGAIKTINSLECNTILIESYNPSTDKYVKSILKKKYYIYNDSGTNKIYVKKNYVFTKSNQIT